MVKNNPNIKDYFHSPFTTSQKKYEALRAFFCEKKSAKEAADLFGYTLSSFYSLIRDFKDFLKNNKDKEDMFFHTSKLGRKEKFADNENKVNNTIISLRKKYLSVPEIKSIMDSLDYNISEKYIYLLIKKEGFARLPRRTKKNKNKVHVANKIKAPTSTVLDYSQEVFQTENAGILCLLPYIKIYKIDEAINNSFYPETSSINKLSSILSFVALKLSNIRRYSADDLWCMDRGTGLFAGLNVLPKTSWFSSYSSRITREMNIKFLKSLHEIWQNNNLLSDTTNLDFVTIPYWGDDSHLENNWSGKRNKGLSSILAAIGQDPDSGIIDYGDTNVRHKNQSEIVLEFLDFYKKDKTKQDIKYLVFDSKFTPYRNLRKLDDKMVKFITIRRRGKNIVKKLNELSKKEWKRIHVMKADGKGRWLKVYEEEVTIKEYGKKTIRQVAITGHGKIKPALIITNDNEITLEELIRKYTRRWIVEKSISEQIEFFHLNQVSSSMVIKVDFDLTMTILSYNLYRLFAQNLPGYNHNNSNSLYNKFLCNSGEVKVKGKTINIILKKKRNLPVLLQEMKKHEDLEISWMSNKKLILSGASTS